MLSIEKLISQAENIIIDASTEKRLLPLIDLTCLDLNTTDEKIMMLCNQAESMAAVCIHPKFIPLAQSKLKNTPPRIVTVANFPEGNHSLNTVIEEIHKALLLGADEIDVVFPYHDYIKGNRQQATTFVKACKRACAKQLLLKIILETGALEKSELIEKASQDIIHAGADFLKTSTGKINVGATLSAAAIILQQIQKANNEGFRAGFKASGGIRTLQQAAGYLYLADQIMGPHWANSETFRVGMSQISLK